MKVQGPNGLIFSMPEDVAQGLLVNEGFREVRDLPTSERTAKGSSKK